MSELTDEGAGGLLRLQASGEVTAVEIVRAHLDRISKRDGRLNAFLRPNPRAEDDAAEIDRQRRDGTVGPLAGVPVAVKDNIDTEGLETTCASKILRGFVPLRDATAVARLRSAGAVVLGKTNLDEFGMGSSTENSAFGPTRNPWDTDRVPGGSSGGSAVAVSARLAPVALGTDTGGSVRQPAALCGVVGLKPTYGRVPRFGLVAFGSSLDQIGPLSRSVADAARLLEVVAGHDPQDQTSSDTPIDPMVDACGSGVDGMRVGIPREYVEGDGLDADIAAAVRDVAKRLENAGASVEEVSLPHTRYAIPTYYLLATAEASSNLARYDGVRYGRRAEGEAANLLEMYRRGRSEGFGPEVQRRILLGTFALSAGYHDQFYGKAQRVRTLIRDDFMTVFRGGIDVLLTPASPSTAFRLGEKVDDPLQMYLSDVYTTTVNLAGLPALAVPAGSGASGLPIGAQLIGPPFRERDLFRAGGVLEPAFPVGRPPEPAEGDERPAVS